MAEGKRKRSIQGRTEDIHNHRHTNAKVCRRSSPQADESGTTQLRQPLGKDQSMAG